MTGFERQRLTMVELQLRPNEVTEHAPARGHARAAARALRAA